MHYEEATFTWSPELKLWVDQDGDTYDKLTVEPNNLYENSQITTLGYPVPYEPLYVPESRRKAMEGWDGTFENMPHFT